MQNPNMYLLQKTWWRPIRMMRSSSVWSPQNYTSPQTTVLIVPFRWASCNYAWPSWCVDNANVMEAARELHKEVFQNAEQMNTATALIHWRKVHVCCMCLQQCLEGVSVHEWKEHQTTRNSIFDNLNKKVITRDVVLPYKEAHYSLHLATLCSHYKLLLIITDVQYSIPSI